MGLGGHIWFVDDGPVGTLASSVGSASLARWEASVVFVAQQTVDDAQYGRRDWLQLDGNPVGSLDVRLGTEAWDVLYGHLRPSSVESTTDLAEHALIALALTEQPEAVFVSYDKTALALGLAELGPGRIVHPFDMWSELRGSGWVTDEEYCELCANAQRRNEGLKIPYRLRDAHLGCEKLSETRR